MIIITGGAGFIGSNLIKRLNQLGIDDICVVDNLTNGIKIKNFTDLSISDYQDKDDFITTDFPNNVEAVFHLGACSSTTEWDGRYLMRNNYNYSKRLLENCRSAQIPFIYASSASVYGSSPKGFSENEENEKPINAYSFSKKLFDDYVRRTKQLGDNVYGMRFFNVYGPREQHKAGQSSPVHLFQRQLAEHGTIKIFNTINDIAPENHLRDFVHVEDCVSAMISCWRELPSSGVYNIGTGNSVSFLRIAQLIVEQMGRGNIEYIPFPQSLLKGYQFYTKANLDRLESLNLGINFRNAEQGIQDFLASI
jgi:ADP-L-glycero-D-manno-heptose 6-epimerase